MVHNPILACFPALSSLGRLLAPTRPDLHTASLHPERLPAFVRNCPSAMRFLDLVGPLPWNQFPERNLLRNWGRTTTPHAAFSATCLLKLNGNLVSMTMCGAT